ncbi:MAG TPA: AAA family ATPase [Candidatus Limnocylindrales bacterium]|nr:AAA family ATPase [Candidatus Limnocylindrales bacterium]
MSIDRLRAHYGFTRMPFGKDLAAGMLHAHRAHGEAVARITWCVSEQLIGVITGECGAGKTVAARAAVSTMDASRHTIIYLGAPGVGLRGIYTSIVTSLGGQPRFHNASLIPQAQDLLAAEHAERGKQVVLIVDLSGYWDYPNSWGRSGVSAGDRR